MKRENGHHGRGLACLCVGLICALAVTMAIPAAADAAPKLKAPGKVKIQTISKSRTGTDNKARITVKWKKLAKNVTKYQVYQKAGSGKWKQIKTVRKDLGYARFYVKGGVKYQFRVRAARTGKINGRKVTRYGKYSKVKKKTVPRYDAKHFEFGDYGCDFYDVVFSNGGRDMSLVFVFRNLDAYTKLPANEFEIAAEQDGKPLKRTAGSLRAQAKGLKTTEYPLRYRLISSDPVRVTLFDGDGGDVLDYVFEVE